MGVLLAVVTARRNALNRFSNVMGRILVGRCELAQGIRLSMHPLLLFISLQQTNIVDKHTRDNIMIYYPVCLAILPQHHSLSYVA